jgi:hypothetical protein
MDEAEEDVLAYTTFPKDPANPILAPHDTNASIARRGK